MVPGQRPHHTPVGDGNDDGVFVRCLDAETPQGTADPDVQVRLTLAPGDHRQITTTPRVELSRPRRLDLGRRLPRPVSDVALAQIGEDLAHCRAEYSGEHLGGMTRPQ